MMMAVINLFYRIYNQKSVYSNLMAHYAKPLTRTEPKDHALCTVVAHSWIGDGLPLEIIISPHGNHGAADALHNDAGKERIPSQAIPNSTGEAQRCAPIKPPSHF